MKILIIDGTAGFSPTRLAEKPCGGIITSLTLIPRFLAKAGHEVTVLSVHNTVEHVDGVDYKPISMDVSSLQADVVVFNRNSIERPIAAYFKMKGARIVWWLHDIVQLSYLPDDGFRLADKIVALSRYCARTYSEFYEITDDKMVVIPNGVDPKVFNPSFAPRKTNLFVSASAQIKGLAPLSFTLHNLRRHNPAVVMRLYASQKLHDQENSASHDAQLQELSLAGAQVLDPIPQKELADVFRQATALLMPNSYPEICSNVLLQAQACGLPIISVPEGALPETVKGGILGYDFLNAVSQLRNVNKWMSVSREGVDHVRGRYEWNRIAGEWLTYLGDQLRGPGDPDRGAVQGSTGAGAQDGLPEVPGP